MPWKTELLEAVNAHVCVGQWNADFSGFWFQEILKIMLREKLEREVLIQPSILLCECVCVCVCPPLLMLDLPLRVHF